MNWLQIRTTIISALSSVFCRSTSQAQECGLASTADFRISIPLAGWNCVTYTVIERICRKWPGWFPSSKEAPSAYKFLWLSGFPEESGARPPAHQTPGSVLAVFGLPLLSKFSSVHYCEYSLCYIMGRGTLLLGKNPSTCTPSISMPFLFPGYFITEGYLHENSIFFLFLFYKNSSAPALPVPQDFTLDEHCVFLMLSQTHKNTQLFKLL